MKAEKGRFPCREGVTPQINTSFNISGGGCPCNRLLPQNHTGGLWGDKTDEKEVFRQCSENTGKTKGNEKKTKKNLKSR